MKEEERFFFKIVKSKKRKGKNEGAMAAASSALSQAVTNTIGAGRIFDVKKYVVPHGSSSNKNLPSSDSSSSDTHSHDDHEHNKQKDKKSSNESMKSVEHEVVASEKKKKKGPSLT